MKKFKEIIWENLPEIDLGIEKSLSESITSPDFSVNIDFKTACKFIYAASPEKFRLAFLQFGIDIKTELDVEAIAELNSTGQDKKICKAWASNYKSRNPVNFKDVVNDIILTQDEINSAMKEINFF